jgi:FkbM family methyltransferase
MNQMSSQLSQGKAIEDLDPAKLLRALSTIGLDPNLRESFLSVCLEMEKHLNYSGSIRDDITAPIVDALFSDVEIVRKTLSTGEVFDFRYLSKIAREFVMSEPRQPEHVWEPQTTKLLLKLSQNAKHVLVGGAYFGDHAVMISKQILPGGGTCHAFEPNQEQFAMLVHNAKLNNLGNLKAYPLGLWSEANCNLKLVGDDSHAHPELIPHAIDDSFVTVTVDGYLAQQGVKSLDLLMLDIEGGEFDVLKGAIAQLSLPEHEAPSIVFEVHRNYVDWTDGLDRTDIARFLMDLGYTLFAVRDFNANFNMSGKPIELVPVNDIYLEGPSHGFNLLGLKGLKKLESIGDYSICPGVSPKLLIHKDPSLHHPIGGL